MKLAVVFVVTSADRPLEVAAPGAVVAESILPGPLVAIETVPLAHFALPSTAPDKLTSIPAVKAFALVAVAVIVFVLDIAFKAINQQGIDKIKEAITTSNENTNTTENNTQQENSENTQVVETESAEINSNTENVEQ